MVRHEYFLVMRTEARKDDALVNRSVQYIVYDSNIRKYVRKAVFSYGFINNEEGEWQDDTLLFEVTKIDNKLDYFKGVRWRGFIKRYGDDEIGLGLYIARPGEDFRLYGETRAHRIKDWTVLSHALRSRIDRELCRARTLRRNPSLRFSR